MIWAGLLGEAGERSERFGDWVSDLVSIVDKSSLEVKSSPFGDVEERRIGETDKDFLAFPFLRLLADLDEGKADLLFPGGLRLADWTLVA